MINKEILRSVVMQQKERIEQKQELIMRDILDEILKSFRDNRILILTGLRRSGKSSILKLLMQEKKEYCYVNFEDERFLGFSAQDFELLNEVLLETYGKSSLYFFDEIQNVDKFELFVRRLQDDGKKVVMTGSNASLLSKELGTRLTGRYKAFEVYPFSFREFLRLKSIAHDKGAVYKAEKKSMITKSFGEYFLEGGLPEYLKNNDIEYVKTVYDNILFRDIIARYSIRKQSVLKDMVNLLASSISLPFTYNSIKNSTGISNANTVKEYISYLSNSYFFFELQKFDYSVKKQLNYPKKIYIVDQAFGKIMGRGFSENKGRVLENIVFIEMKRRKKDVYYYSGKSECDFVVRENSKIKEAIQVCYVLSEINKEREISGILEAMKNFGLRKGIILTNDEEYEIKELGKKIEIKPVWKWLLENEA